MNQGKAMTVKRKCKYCGKMFVPKKHNHVACTRGCMRPNVYKAHQAKMNMFRQMAKDYVNGRVTWNSIMALGPSMSDMKKIKVILARYM